MPKLKTFKYFKILNLIMPKKRKKEDSFEKIKSFLTEIFLKNIISSVKDQFDYFLEKIQDRVYQTEKGIIERLIAAVFVAVGFVFLFLSLHHYLLDVQTIPKYLSFLIVGVISISLALMIKYTMINKK